MLSSPDPFVRAFSRFDRPATPAVFVVPPQSQQDWNTVEQVWSDAFIHFDARVQAILARAQDRGNGRPSPSSEWCIACLGDVRRAIYELHVWVLYEHVPLTAGAPAIVSYLSEAYVWCGDVLDDIDMLLEDVRNRTTHRDPVVARDSDAYVEDFLCPLLARVCDTSREAEAPTPAYQALVRLAERLHIAVVSLNWALLSN
jgi:hypothetical protein